MKILLVNDDGYKAHGIVKLATALSKEHEVVVIAPVKCMSGMAHAMTFGKPVYLKKIEKYPYECYSLSGTPADCVKLGSEFLKKKPDLVISGINTEPNIGTTVVYSGTAAAAMEASLLGYRAMAVSSNPESEADYDYAVSFFLEHFDYYLSMASTEYALNININNASVGNKAHKIVPIGIRKFTDIYIVGDMDESGLEHTLVGNPIPVENSEFSDVAAFDSGYATITPLTSDHTCFGVMERLAEKAGS